MKRKVVLKVTSQRFELVAWPLMTDHLIRKIISGVCRDSHRFEEYLKIIEIDDHFFRMNVHFSRFSPLKHAWITSPLGYFCLAHRGTSTL